MKGKAKTKQQLPLEMEELRTRLDATERRLEEASVMRPTLLYIYNVASKRSSLRKQEPRRAKRLDSGSSPE